MADKTTPKAFDEMEQLVPEKPSGTSILSEIAKQAYAKEIPPADAARLLGITDPLYQMLKNKGEVSAHFTELAKLHEAGLITDDEFDFSLQERMCTRENYKESINEDLEQGWRDIQRANMKYKTEVFAAAQKSTTATVIQAMLEIFTDPSTLGTSEAASAINKDMAGATQNISKLIVAVGAQEMSYDELAKVIDDKIAERQGKPVEDAPDTSV